MDEQMKNTGMPEDELEEKLPVPEDLSGEDDQELPPEKGITRDFLRGAVFGMLLSAIILMTYILFRFGTIDFFGSKSGADQLTSKMTMRKIEQVKAIITDEYLYDADGQELTDFLFMGIAAGLNDTYAEYTPLKGMKHLTENEKGEFRGIGITIVKVEDSPCRIVELHKGGPAQEAGLAVGDLMIEAAGTDIREYSPDQVADLIEEHEEEDQIGITVQRDDQQIAFTVRYDTIQFGRAEGEMLEDGIGYIQIPTFDEVTVDTFRNVLMELTAQGAEKLVIDLRNNPGGLLNSVCPILSMLVPKGDLVYAQSKDGSEEVFTTTEKRIFTGTIAVLVNQGSASASELFAGNIQDCGCGVVIGTQTYGKGVMQTSYRLADGSAFRLTTQKYLTRGRQDINGVGVTPDIWIGDEEAPEEALTETEELQELSSEETSGDAADEPDLTEDAALAAAVRYLKEN